MTLSEIQNKVRAILAMTSSLTPSQIDMNLEIKDTYYTSNEKSVLVNRLVNAFSWVSGTDLMNKVMSSLKTGAKIATYVNDQQ